MCPLPGREHASGEERTRNAVVESFSRRLPRCVCFTRTKSFFDPQYNINPIRSLPTAAHEPQVEKGSAIAP